MCIESFEEQSTPIKDAAYYLQQKIESDAPYVREVLLRCSILPGEEVRLTTIEQLLNDWYFKQAEREIEENQRMENEEREFREMEAFLEREYEKCGYC